MSKFKGMCFYYDWLEPLRLVPDRQFKEFILSMLKYHQDGTPPPDFKGKTAMAAGFIFPQIQRSVEFSQLGQKGGLKTQSKRAAASTDEHSDAQIQNKTETKQNKTFTKQDKTETVTETKQEASENPSAEPNGNSPTLSSPDGAGEVDEGHTDTLNEEMFEKFWDVYPKRSARSTAYRAFCELGINKDTLPILISAVKMQTGSEEWQRENGRYIPNPTTWLLGRRWEDEPCIVGRANVEDVLQYADRSHMPYMTYTQKKGQEMNEWFDAKLKKMFGD